MSITLITSVVSATLLGLSEVLSYVKQIKSNGIFQLIVDILTSHKNKDKDNTHQAQAKAEAASQDQVLNSSTMLNHDVEKPIIKNSQEPQIYINNLIYITNDNNIDKEDDALYETNPSTTT